MPQRLPNTFHRTRAAAISALLAGCLLAFMLMRSGPAGDRKAPTVHGPPPATPPAREQASSGDARRHPALAIRTTAAASAPQPPMMVCPLEAIDAGSGERLDEYDATLPEFIQVAFQPPIIASATITLLDGEAHIPKHAAERLQHLPFHEGTVYGEDPSLGPVSITVEQGACTRLQVFVIGSPPPDAIACALGDGLGTEDITRLSYAAGPRAGQTIDNRSWGDVILLEGVGAEGEGWAHRTEGPPLPFGWGPEGCDDLAPVGSARVTVHIPNPPQGAPAWVGGCGQTKYLEPGNSSVELEVPAVPCALEAWRIDGAFRALSHLETVDPEPNAHLMVTLPLPEERTAGLGIQFRPGEEFVRITGVLPNTPAWEAGLRRGDRIVAIDGEAVGGLETSDFIVLGTGLEGTLAEIEIQNEDEPTEIIRIERALVDRRM